MGVVASDSALLWVMCAPTGPYFRGGVRPLSLLAIGDTVRAWPGGTGEHKIAVNYGPTLKPQQAALDGGYDQTLWLFGDRITEAGVMNFFVALKRDDGGEFSTSELAVDIQLTSLIVEALTSTRPRWMAQSCEA